MQYALQYRDPRRFSMRRLTALAQRRMQHLRLSEVDLRYTFVYGQRIRHGNHLCIVLRRRDMPVADRSLNGIAKRNGIVLIMDRRGWVLDIERDKLAPRKLKSRGGEPMAKPRHTRLARSSPWSSGEAIDAKDGGGAMDGSGNERR